MQPGVLKRLGIVLACICSLPLCAFVGKLILGVNPDAPLFLAYIAWTFMGAIVVFCGVGIIALTQYIKYGTINDKRIEKIKQEREQEKERLERVKREQEARILAQREQKRRELDELYVKALDDLDNEIRPKVLPIE